MKMNNKNNEVFKELFTEFMIENYGERCPDYDENCATCQAWDNYDTLFTKLESGDDVYEYQIKAFNMFNKAKLNELSKEGWNVCASNLVPKISVMLPNIPKSANTLFYFRKKLQKG